MEETKWLKPSVSVSRIGDSASVGLGNDDVEKDAEIDVDFPHQRIRRADVFSFAGISADRLIEPVQQMPYNSLQLVLG
jgi:hypothetical protein